MERSVLFRAFADNPIVLRDLRATMRGTRAFWFQAAYLGLLGILAVTGYALSTGQNLFNSGGGQSQLAFSIVDAQQKLQAFYYFIFLTLAGLITLIAPALTATSVSDERQRQSLDLLITTPLSATEMLVGKLMSSLAFLGLLLTLSLPASALCVLLGGATLGDMLRVYALLAVDAVVLASIGLYFSCACKNSLHAVIWTYASVIAFAVFAFYGGLLGGSTGNPMSISGLKPIAALGLLSPPAAIFPAAGGNIMLGKIAIPVALLTLPAAFLAIRLLLTAATYRFGTFGAESGRSLRKQVLLVSGLVALVAGHTVARSSTYTNYDESYRNDDALMGPMWGLFAGLFALSLPFLPGLFVPVRAEDAPPGDAQNAQAGRDNGCFSIGSMLLPRHSGALPYFYTWLAIAAAGIMASFTLGARSHELMIFQTMLAGTLYAAGAGTLAWGVSRLAARFVQAASSARALAFGLFIMINAVPALPLTLMDWNEQTKPTMFLGWLGSPALFMSDNDLAIPAIVLSGLASLLLGLTIGLLSKPQKA